MPEISGKGLLTQLEKFASQPPDDVLTDADLRMKLYRAGRAATLAIEQPHDLIVRLLLSQVSLIQSTIFVFREHFS